MDAEELIQVESEHFRLSESYASQNGQDIVGRSYCNEDPIYVIEEVSVVSESDSRVLLPETLKEFFVTEKGDVVLESGELLNETLFGECSICSGSHKTDKQVIVLNSFDVFHTDCFEELSMLIRDYIQSHQERFLVHGL